MRPLLLGGMVAMAACCATTGRPSTSTTEASTSCRSDDLARGRVAIAELDARISTLDSSADVSAINASLSQLLTLPCMRASSENSRSVHFDAAIQSQVWWQRGGRDWLESFLRATGAPVILPPDVLPVLTRSMPESSALRPLVCATGDLTCGTETASWSLRAEQAWSDAMRDNATAQSECSSAAMALAAGSRYRDWRTCIEVIRPRRPVLPLGRLRAPTDGWMTIRRRIDDGNQPCNELRVYSLETGAAFVARACRLPASTTWAPTEVVAGRAALDALREATWMSFLAPYIPSHVQPDAAVFPLPPGIPRTPLDHLGDIAEVDPNAVAVGGNDPMHWYWSPSAGPVASGTLLWPRSSRAGESYADDLWRVVDASFAPGCTPTGPPPLGAAGETPEGRALQAFQPTICPATF